MLGERAALDNQRFCSWFGPVASAGEAMVWEPQTERNPSVDADESSRRRLDRTEIRTVDYYYLPYVVVAGVSKMVRGMKF
ncbi:MAG: hypothetical protein ABSE39_08260 [Candidatus Bathyarchaeia archaeon]|jgi:hypothetical protein